MAALSIFQPGDSIDPATAISDFDLMSGGMLYDNLVKLDNSFVPHPALAESWEVNRDATVWTFRLRKGVHFHSGAPLTADDVIYTLKRILNPKVGSSAQAALAAVLKPSGIQKVDSLTVRLRLTSPDAFLTAILGGYNLRITPSGATNLKLKEDGTGPFVLKKYVPGELFEVARNNHYWQSGLPYLNGMRVEGIPEEAAKVAAVQAGTANIADAIDTTTAKQLQANKNVTLYKLKGASFNVIAVQAHVAPYDKLKVRQALKMALNRQEILDVVVQGEGLLGQDIPIASNDALYPSGFHHLPYDPEKAKSLLASAGFSSGLPVTLYTADAAAYMVETATAYQSLVAPANIHVTLKQTPAASYFTNIWLNKPCFSSFWLREHPDTIIEQACVTKGVWNEAQFSNADFDGLIRAARSTTNQARQRSLYAQAMPLLADQSGWIITQWGNRIWPATTTFKGVALDFINNADFHSAYLTT